MSRNEAEPEDVSRDYCKITVQFGLTKGEGNRPVYSAWPKKNRTHAYLRSVMEFCPAFEEVEDIIASWNIVDDGLDGFTFGKTSFHGTPSPIVEFILTEELDDDESEDFLHAVWDSYYKLEIPGINSGDPYFYEDHNGWCEIISIERIHYLPLRKTGGPKKKSRSALAKNIEKGKWFEQRLSLFEAAKPSPTGSELLECLNVVFEKAKYSVHFARIAYLCKKLKCGDLELIKKCAARATSDPRDAGSVVRAFFASNLTKAGEKHWSAMVESFKDNDSYYAQILAYGLLFKETKTIAKRKIAEFLNSGPAAKEYEVLTHAPPP